MYISEFVIEGKTVSQNEDGLYLLKDIYNISKESNIESKAPHHFFYTSQTKLLLQHLDPSSIVRIRGPKGGVWVNKEIALAYAMWVSPDIYIKVMRVFIAMGEGDVIKAAELVDTQKAKEAVLKMVINGLQSDRMMLKDEEVVSHVLKRAYATSEDYMDRLILKAQFEVLGLVSKKGMTVYKMASAVVSRVATSSGYVFGEDKVTDIIYDMARHGSISLSHGLITNLH